MRAYKNGDHASFYYPIVLDLMYHKGTCDSPDFAKLNEHDAKEVEKLVKELPEGFNTVMTRAAHFTAMNTLPSTPGTKWEITEEIYWEFLECLPPLYNKKFPGFLICEAVADCAEGTIRSNYYKLGGKYWHEYVIDNDSSY